MRLVIQRVSHASLQLMIKSSDVAVQVLHPRRSEERRYARRGSMARQQGGHLRVLRRRGKMNLSLLT